MNKLFRCLIVIVIIFQTILWVIPYFQYLWLTEDELTLLQYDGYGGFLTISSAFTYWAFYLVFIFSKVGMFMFFPIARVAFFGAVLLSIIAQLFFGIAILAPEQSIIGSIVTLLYGALLAIAYLTSVDQQFKSSN